MKGGGFEHSLLIYIDKNIKRYDQFMNCLTKPYWPKQQYAKGRGQGDFLDTRNFTLHFLENLATVITKEKPAYSYHHVLENSK